MALPCGLRPICFLGVTLHEEWFGYEAVPRSSISLAPLLVILLLPFCRRADHQQQQERAIVGALQD